MRVNNLKGHIGKIEIVNGAGAGSDHYSARNFSASNVACVVADEASFHNVKFGFEGLGFEVACSSSLEAIFETVSESPEDWAMIVVRLDQPLNEECLESFVRLTRLMDVRIPIIVMLQKDKPLKNYGCGSLYADCVVGEPKSKKELSTAIGVAVNANRRWGSSFEHFRSDTGNRIHRPSRR
ncbi:hypothetical protein [Thalassovita sp.]|uniref:hypothetical protein n=1 Tax=Thalassovita sp. TaxID=1979401 RepID=UPI002AB05B09|nr:hypothetical protein [Thalassovita sp.]